MWMEFPQGGDRTSVREEAAHFFFFEKKPLLAAAPPAFVPFRFEPAFVDAAGFGAVRRSTIEQRV